MSAVCSVFALSVTLDDIVTIINFATDATYFSDQSTHSPGNTIENMSKVGMKTSRFTFVSVMLTLPLCAVLIHLGSWS